MKSKILKMVSEELKAIRKVKEKGMKHWRFAIIKQKKGGYRIAEYFGKYGYTEEPLTITGESKKDLIWYLEAMLSDAKKYRTIVEK